MSDHPTPNWPLDGRGGGVVELPSGRRVRGRGLHHDTAEVAGVAPTFGLYLLGRPPPAVPWDARWVVWPDFRLPRDVEDARTAFAEVLARASDERVEIACHGGTGRTGTALACLAALDGVPAGEAVAWVRTRYRPRAVETPWQRRFVHRFAG